MRIKFVSLVALVTVISLLIGGCNTPSVPPSGEVESTEYMGVKLTPMNNQGNNALVGTQTIDRESYVLTVDGLTTNTISLSYQDLLDLPILLTEGNNHWIKAMEQNI